MTTHETLRLRILMPTECVLEDDARQVTAEGEEGWFCLKPRHTDFVASLVPGWVEYIDAEGRTRHVAVHSGLLVKSDREVRVATHLAVAGPELDALGDRIHERFESLSKEEHDARNAARRLEARLVRRFMDL